MTSTALPVLMAAYAPEGDDDWLTVIATGRCVGVTAQSVVDQYPRPGVVYLPVRDAEPIAVRLVWWRDDPHPATRPVLELLTGLYRT